MDLLPLLFAADEPPQMSTLEAFMKSPMPILFLGFIVMIVFMSRNSARQRREQQAMFAALKKNDKVVTSAGIIGVVVSIKENEDEVTLRVDDTSNTRIRVLKSSIVRITPDGAPAPATTPDSKT